jgi:chorismate mutase
VIGLTVANMSSLTPDEILLVFRSQLDDLDIQIIELLSRRVADCKARHQIPMLQPDRIDKVKARVKVLAEQHGLDERFIEEVYDLIIQEACRIEVKIMERRQTG